MLNEANFKKHLAREGNITATDLKPLVQCATASFLDDKDRSREMQKHPDGGMSVAMGPDPGWARRMALQSKLERRNRRGGMNHRPEDAIEQY